MEKIEYNGMLYFISEKYLNNNIILPRIPNNFFTKNGYENNKIKRVCFCKSIDKCLMVLSKNCKGLVFNVYTVSDISKYDIFKPSIDEVPDSKITEELWVLTKVEVEYVGKIKCIDSFQDDGYEFRYGDKTSRLYEWKYEWI